MRVTRRAARHAPAPPDRAVERYFAGMRVELTPDPLFKRRLRGVVVNRYVAAREGNEPVPRRQGMGRLGRAVLYASFSTAVFAASVLGASQEALPGELLYPLKLHVERLRERALPDHLDDELAAHTLTERISELGRLAERGEWDRVASQIVIVEARYREFEATVAEEGPRTRYRVVLAGVLERLPRRARTAVEDVLQREPGPRPDAANDEPVDHRGSRGSGTAPAAGDGPRDDGGAGPGPREGDPRPRPSRPPRPIKAIPGGGPPPSGASPHGDGSPPRGDD